MPIYEYKCQGCGEDFEKLVSGINPDVLCPRCSSKDIKRKFSVFGLSGGERQAGASGSTCSSCSSSSCSTCN